ETRGKSRAPQLRESVVRRCRCRRACTGFPQPCNLRITKSAKLAGAVTDGRPPQPRALKLVPQHGSPSVVPSNPNSRQGRNARSSIRQGRVAMESTIVVGIDVSKDRLDVAVRPSGAAFVVERNAGGLEVLIARLRELSPAIVALEATGGFETVAGAGLSRPPVPVGLRHPAAGRAFSQALR